MSSSRDKVGERLRAAREYLGLTQKEVAESVGISRSAISLIENGERRLESLELRRLSELYGRPTSDFLGDENRALPDDIQALLRKAGEMTAEDREEISRFADWLLAKRESKK